MSEVNPSQKRRLLYLSGNSQQPMSGLPPMLKQEEWDVIQQGTHPKVGAAIVEDIWAMPSVASESMHAVFSPHNLQMLHAYQLKKTLAEFMRVLVPGGFVLVTVTDLQAVSAYVADGRLENKLYDSAIGPVSPIDLMFGFRKGIEEGVRESHKSGFSAITLASHLKTAGLTTISIRREWVNLWAIGYKLPAAHPQRREMPAIENIDIIGQQGALLPWWYRRQLEVQQGTEVLSDNLEAEPQIWKPVGLKK